MTGPKRAIGNIRIRWILAVFAWCCAATSADETLPRAVPRTRDDVVRALNALKDVQPWVPLPPVTPEELAALGERYHMHSALARYRYLPKELREALLVTGREPEMTIDARCVSDVFWVVCRINNCHYCLGHTEAGTIAPGKAPTQSTEQLRAEARKKNEHYLALDGNWSGFAERDQALYWFAVKITHEPNRLSTADVDALRSHFNNREIVHLLMTTSGQNAMNRWVHSLGLPQERHREYPAPEADLASRTGLLADLAVRHNSRPSSDRGPWESRAEVDASLKACTMRTPVVPLVEEKTVEQLLARRNLPTTPITKLTQLLAYYPTVGLDRWMYIRAAAEKGELEPAWRAKIAWNVARQDRAWYALGRAKAQLKSLGLTDEQIFALDASVDSLPPAERAVFSFARKLSVAPGAVVKSDVDAIRAHFSDRKTVEIIFHAAFGAFIDRLTEAAKLPLETQ